MSTLINFIAQALSEFEELFHNIHLWLGTDWTKEEDNNGMNFFERLKGEHIGKDDVDSDIDF